MFLEAATGPCIKTHVFFVFSYFRGRSRSEAKHVYFCVFLRPDFRKTRVFVGFCVCVAFMLPRVKCGDLYVFLCVFEVFLKRERPVDVVWRREAQMTKIE